MSGSIEQCTTPVLHHVTLKTTRKEELLVSPTIRENPDKLADAGLHYAAHEFETVGDLLENFSRLRDHGTGQFPPTIPPAPRLPA